MPTDVAIAIAYALESCVKISESYNSTPCGIHWSALVFAS